LDEVGKGIVDTSVAAFSYTLEREEVAYFSAGFFHSRISVIVRRPNDRDVSLRYDLLEYKTESWLLILLGYLSIWICLSVILFVLLLNNIEKQKLTQSIFATSLTGSLTVCLRAFISKVSHHCFTLLHYVYL
jgi:uncharacterized membrane protein YhaH (DUF805 family)